MLKLDTQFKFIFYSPMLAKLITTLMSNSYETAFTIKTFFKFT